MLVQSKRWRGILSSNREAQENGAPMSVQKATVARVLAYSDANCCNCNRGCGVRLLHACDTVAVVMLLRLSPAQSLH